MYSPFPCLHAALTSSRRVDAVEPTCSALMGQPLNPMKAVVALNHLSTRSAQHHGETHLCVPLPFVLSSSANIARKKPGLNRDKTNVIQLVRDPLLGPEFLLDLVECVLVHGVPFK